MPHPLIHTVCCEIVTLLLYSKTQNGIVCKHHLNPRTDGLLQINTFKKKEKKVMHSQLFSATTTVLTTKVGREGV